MQIEQLKDNVIKAAREYYSASETIISEIGTDNATEDDFATQVIADNALHSALKALDDAGQPTLSFPNRPVVPTKPAVFWCRCVSDCKNGMTEAERDEHERMEHSGQRPRKDLDDVPPELRRARQA